MLYFSFLIIMKSWISPLATAIIVVLLSYPAYAAVHAVNCNMYFDNTSSFDVAVCSKNSAAQPSLPKIVKALK